MDPLIKLVYGAYLEYLISNMHLQRLSGMEHLIHIFSVPDSKVLLGAVRFQKLRGSYTPWLAEDPNHFTYKAMFLLLQKQRSSE